MNASPDRGTVSGLYRKISADLTQYMTHSEHFSDRKTGLLRKVSVLCTPCLMCCMLYRMSHWLHERGWGGCAQVVALANFVVHKAAINPRSSIGGGLYIPHPVGVVFDGRAGERLTLFARATVSGDGMGRGSLDRGAHDRPTLGEDVVVGAHAVIAGGVAVGDGTIIGANAVLMTGVPSRSTVYTRSRQVVRERWAGDAD